MNKKRLDDLEKKYWDINRDLTIVKESLECIRSLFLAALILSGTLCILYGAYEFGHTTAKKKYYIMCGPK